MSSIDEVYQTESLDEELSMFPTKTSFDIDASKVQPLDSNQPIFEIKPEKNPKFEYIFTEKEQHIQKLEKQLDKVKDKPKTYPENELPPEEFYEEDEPENQSFLPSDNGVLKKGMIKRDYSIDIDSEEMVVFQKPKDDFYDADDEYKAKKKKSFCSMLFSCLWKTPEEELFLDFDDYDRVEDDI
eukprot:gene8429-254_t